MDLATENRIALLLMQEATKLRIEAEKEGVHAYLRRPKVRGQPNSRFLTATVLGVQQANKATEVNKMWKVRIKELELDKEAYRMKYEDRGDASSKQPVSSRYDKDDKNGVVRRKRKECGNGYSYLDDDDSARVEHTEFLSSSKPRKHGKLLCSDDDNVDGELGDEEMEGFLLSRVKRGRGGIGSRMDETGPYLPSTSSDPSSKMLDETYMGEREGWEKQALGLDKSSTHLRWEVVQGVEEKMKKPMLKEVQRSGIQRMFIKRRSQEMIEEMKRKKRRRKGSPGIHTNADTRGK